MAARGKALAVGHQIALVVLLAVGPEGAHAEAECAQGQQPCNGAGHDEADAAGASGRRSRLCGVVGHPLAPDLGFPGCGIQDPSGQGPAHWGQPTAAGAVIPRSAARAWFATGRGRWRGSRGGGRSGQRTEESALKGGRRLAEHHHVGELGGEQRQLERVRQAAPVHVSLAGEPEQRLDHVEEALTRRDLHAHDRVQRSLVPPVVPDAGLDVRSLVGTQNRPATVAQDRQLSSCTLKLSWIPGCRCSPATRAPGSAVELGHRAALRRSPTEARRRWRAPASPGSRSRSRPARTDGCRVGRRDRDATSGLRYSARRPPPPMTFRPGWSHRRARWPPCWRSWWRSTPRTLRPRPRPLRALPARRHGAAAPSSRADRAGPEPRPGGALHRARERGDGDRTIYFHGHFDVVPAQDPAQFHPRRREGTISGRGATT